MHHISKFTKVCCRGREEAGALGFETHSESWMLAALLNLTKHGNNRGNLTIVVLSNHLCQYICFKNLTTFKKHKTLEGNAFKIFAI